MLPKINNTADSDRPSISTFNEAMSAGLAFGSFKNVIVENRVLEMNQPVVSAWMYHSKKLRCDAPIVCGAASAVLLVMLVMIGLHEQWHLLPKTLGKIGRAHV